MNRLSVDQLADASRFEEMVRLDLHTLVDFVTQYYYKRITPVVMAHYVFSFLTLAAWVASCWWGGLDFDQWAVSLGWGVLLFIILLPLHEAIHGLAYTAFGARDVRYGILPKHFVVYAVAHHFVADRREFTWVALAPFLVISAGLAVLALALPQFQQVLLAALMFHTSGTSGDFAMLNYLHVHKRRTLYTYDDADNKITYFHAALDKGE